jgi:hypothetical protein
MPEPVANDFSIIRAVMIQLRFERLGCNARKSLPIGECWCFHAGPNGESIGCQASIEADQANHCC